jgi:hypothetical protein
VVEGERVQAIDVFHDELGGSIYIEKKRREEKRGKAREREGKRGKEKERKRVSKGWERFISIKDRVDGVGFISFIIMLMYMYSEMECSVVQCSTCQCTVV